MITHSTPGNYGKMLFKYGIWLKQETLLGLDLSREPTLGPSDRSTEEKLMEVGA